MKKPIEVKHFNNDKAKIRKEERPIAQKKQKGSNYEIKKKEGESEFDLENFAYNQNEKPIKEKKPKKQVEDKNRDK